MPTVQWYHFMKLICIAIHIKLLILTKFLVSQCFLSVIKFGSLRFFSHYADLIRKICKHCKQKKLCKTLL